MSHVIRRWNQPSNTYAAENVDKLLRNLLLKTSKEPQWDMCIEMEKNTACIVYSQLGLRSLWRYCSSKYMYMNDTEI